MAISARVIRSACDTAFRVMCAYAARNELIHRTVGIAGNACFVAASVARLASGDARLAMWLFLIAATGMLIDRSMAAAVYLHRRRARA